MPYCISDNIVRFDDGRAYRLIPKTIVDRVGFALELDGILIPIDDDFKTQSNRIDNVIFNDPATIVLWKDGSKTVVKCQPGDTYSKELGLAMCIAKKYLGNKGNFNEVFKTWIGEDISVEDMRKELEKHCFGRRCSECELNTDNFRCGRGTYFIDKNYDGSYLMTDDEIREAYRVVFGK